jgi:hypothetical protein
MTARHENRKAKQTCQRCRDRKALFQYRGQVKADRNHTLCFECYRSARERQRAERLSCSNPPTGGRLFGSRLLTDDEIAHRRRMIAHLDRAQ